VWARNIADGMRIRQSVPVHDHGPGPSITRPRPKKVLFPATPGSGASLRQTLLCAHGIPYPHSLCRKYT
jgi:hypothetical protein